MEFRPYPRRHSLRLPEYDYSQEGEYFVTICTQNKICYFGEIESGQMHLNRVGLIIDKWWQELNHAFSPVQIDQYIIMPNHFHGIITIVGGDLCVTPLWGGETAPDGHTGPSLQRRASLPGIIQWFKTMTTNEYIKGVKYKGWIPIDRRLWQRGFYDHIIRNVDDLHKIRTYITNNPLKWHIDQFNR